MNIKTMLSQIFNNKNVRFWGLQVCLALFLLFVGIYAVLLSLDSFTRHGEFVVVPDLKHVSFSKAQELLEKSHLRYEIDSIENYNENFPAYTVMEQEPEANEKVKKNRKIYLTINRTNYQKVPMIDIIHKPLGAVRPNLLSYEFEIGKITYVNDIGKDMVLRAFHKGKEIHVGDMIRKKSVIDLECGNGMTMPELDTIIRSREPSEEHKTDNDGIDF